LADSPVVTIARLLGGVVLMQGRLGHQVLGQMLVANSSEVAVAGAAVVVTATARQRNVVAQMALRTAAPLLAARAILYKQERRIERIATLLEERQRQLAKRAQELEDRARQVGEQAAARIAALEREKRELQGELAALWLRHLEDNR
jgi:hypothetical protein